MKRKLNFQLFPEENGNGVIKLSGNTVVYDGKNDKIIHEQEKVKLDGLERAHVSRMDDQLYLLLRDHYKRHRIPVNYKGFREVYRTLSQKFSFDDEVFEEIISDPKIGIKEIWQKEHERTYKILEGKYEDYGQGYEIQSPDKEFVLWDTPYKCLKIKKYTDVRLSAKNRIKVLSYKYPVRIGNIVVKDLRFDLRRKKRKMHLSLSIGRIAMIDGILTKVTGK